VDVSTPRADIDLGVSVLWPEKILSAQLQQAPYVNLHPAPLPRFRGRNAPAHAILNGDRFFGATLHYMDDGFDTGPIIAGNSFVIDPLETGHGLWDKAQRAAYDLFVAFWPSLVNYRGRLSAQPQGEGTYYAADSLDAYKSVADPLVARALNFPGR
jgi:methionyl-tRNA formyltransferase